MVRKSFTKLFAASSLALLLGACSILPKAPQLTVYKLPQLEVQRQQAVTVNEVIRVAIPYTRNYLDTHRIIVVTPEHSLAVMDGIRWEDLGPIVFRDSLIRALRSANRYRAVINDDTAAGDYSLRSELQDFQLDYSVEPAEVVISVDTSLSSLKTKDYPISTASFSAREPLEAASDEAVLNAFAKANQQIHQQVIQWLSSLPSSSMN